MDSKQVIIIGCGVIGACSAYYLRKAGWEVTMVDQGKFGKACSHGNCGLISPSHALPLTVPGAVMQTLPMMFKRNAPMRIKPRLDPKLWLWLTRFALRCREKPMLESAAGRSAMLLHSVELYRQLLAEEHLQVEWEDRGGLFVYQSEAGMDSYDKFDRWLQGFGLGAERIDGEALVKMEPAIKPGAAAGAWFYKMDAHVRPDKVMSELHRVLLAMGVSIHEDTTVTGIVRDSGEAKAITTSAGEMSAERFVLATGAWTPKMNAWLGAKVPIQPGKGYSITMPRPGVCPTIPCVFQEHRVAVTPFQSGYRIGSTMEFAGYDTSINRTRLDALKQGASAYLHEPTCEPIEEEWYGWRPMTYDGKPIIDHAPAMENLVVAAGHNMLGLSMGPGTGQMVSELVCGEPTSLDAKAYAISRF